ncbi:PTS fructose transporter subunit IIA [Alkalicella caledoniensis]|uniref:PTS fructose transporter subunit IIA n=1 Tax=Alkalicella caledoniensis TaxID=2731377 RepID=A0A7G9W5W1_ALKCA|nr:PTS fructose transporter subunit IIA [Alkalicella caledoniensis]QNO14073.1 PTS fructose transporter subunit IIA [Alkalicella caledoniensis]
MRKIVLATHGAFADGIKSCLETLIGHGASIKYISAYTQNTDIDKEIREFFSNIDDDDELVIFTDLMGGSITQKFVPFCHRPNTFLIAGFNLAIVLEIVLNDSKLSKKEVLKLINNAREQLTCVNYTDLPYQYE